MKYDFSSIPETGMVFNPSTGEVINLLPFYSFIEEFGETTFEASTRLEGKINNWIRGDENIDDSEVAGALIKLCHALKMMSIDNLNRDDGPPYRKP
ncbi:MAG: hypothetical protein MUF45_15210 [Spirosomaceae bacterium]|jgi:hypothetical protein|nr:hypothetical protein [Spirosomataceae bacterium]